MIVGISFLDYCHRFGKYTIPSLFTLMERNNYISMTSVSWHECTVLKEMLPPRFYRHRFYSHNGHTVIMAHKSSSPYTFIKTQYGVYLEITVGSWISISNDYNNLFFFSCFESSGIAINVINACHRKHWLQRHVILHTDVQTKCSPSFIVQSLKEENIYSEWLRAWFILKELKV